MHVHPIHYAGEVIRVGVVFFTRRASHHAERQAYAEASQYPPTHTFGNPGLYYAVL